MASSNESADDIFNDILTLETDFYEDGYRLGEADGEREGRLEGRAFGIEKGFDKYFEMGKMNGRATIWANRLDSSSSLPSKGAAATELFSADATTKKSSKSPPAGRLQSHLKTLYALTEPGSLSTENNEEAVAQFDDRLRRAHGKMKIVEKMVGDTTARDTLAASDSRILEKQKEGNIEDVSILHARH